MAFCQRDFPHNLSLITRTAVVVIVLIGDRRCSRGGSRQRTSRWTSHHAALRKIRAGRREFVEPVINSKHLGESFIATGSAPRLLNGLDVLGLGDGRAQPVRSAEFLDEVAVMGKRVLAGETEAVGAHPRFSENHPLLMIASERSIDGGERGLVDDIPANKIAKVEEGTEGSQHLGRDVALDGGKVYLEFRTILVSNRAKTEFNHLHERLGVVPRPLLKASTFRKSPQPRERRDSCNSKRSTSKST